MQELEGEKERERVGGREGNREREIGKRREKPINSRTNNGHEVATTEFLSSCRGGHGGEPTSRCCLVSCITHSSNCCSLCCA